MATCAAVTLLLSVRPLLAPRPSPPRSLASPLPSPAAPPRRPPLAIARRAFPCATHTTSAAHPWALTFNDASPNENHHTSAALGDVLLRKRCNFLAGFKSKVDKAGYARFRKLVIAIVLATDMARHFQTVADFKSRFGTKPLPDDFEWDAGSRFVQHIRFVPFATCNTSLIVPMRSSRLLIYPRSRGACDDFPVRILTPSLVLSFSCAFFFSCAPNSNTGTTTSTATTR